ncbi:MAG: cellulase family glycosylhydrolase, partial [Kiritimatiellales bacterium]|nr:cellulase family glycosylhydrolase [Kiritimatiellales bacterium]
MKKTLFAVVAFLAVAVNPVRAELWMPSIFSSGMVLQSGRPVPVWGEADPGSTIGVSFNGQIKESVAATDGHWSVTLDALLVSMIGEAMTVTASSESQTKTFTDVVVGEVWLLAGQSNMGWTLADCDGGTEAAAVADYPWLRIFSQWPNQGACDEPARDVIGGQWNVCTPARASGLSGVGFFFVRALQEALPPSTPLALVNTQMGGTYAECWIDFQTLENTPSASPFLEKAANEIIPGVSDPDGFWGEDNFRRPSALYNGKVAPLQPFAIRGVIWYQGEGNSQNWLADGYGGTLSALVDSWRQQWGWADLPFLIVQLPRYNAGDWNDWPAVRAAQAQVARDLPGVELAVTIDCGAENQIHPPDKEPVGERLALLAQAKVYGQTVECSGPVFQSSEIKDGAVLVELAFADGMSFSGGIARGFEICRPDGQFVPAQAEIMYDGRVRISSPAVPSPIGARYGWFNWGEVSLVNTQGLPAAPFTWTSELVDPVEYIGLKPTNDGNLYAATNWIGGVLPTEANGLIGRVDGTEMPVGKTFWMPGITYDFALRQEGGLCVRNGDLNLRGGVTNATFLVPGRTLWEIDDAANDPSSHTNFSVTGNLVVWSHMGGGIELDLLRGCIEIGGTFRMVATDKGIVNIKDGILHSQYFRSHSGVVNMLAGGVAKVALGRLETAERNVVFNFETGNRGSITIAQTDTGASFGTNGWQSLANAGKLKVDGTTVGLESFALSNGGSTIQHIGALPGLTMVNGKLYKDGAVYRGIGVNYCDLFQAMISFPEYPGQTTYRTLEGLQYLGERGVPFVRFWACGFWPIDWNLYFQDKEEWFSRMDLLVATAEQAGVGLIVDLFWRSETIPNLVEEYRDQWANPDSQVRQFMSNYVAEVVGRYKDSSAIWGWEFANELSNVCDLPNWTNGLGTPIPSKGVGGISIEVNERNKMTYAIAEEIFNAFSAEVRKYDAHRFITTGSSRPRPSAWHNRMENSWGVDNYA